MVSKTELTELLPIAEQHAEAGFIQTVNARDLHAALGVGRDFSNWIKGRIAKYCFKSGVDYVEILPAKTGEQDSSNNHGGHNAIEYHLSLDMAKELSMVENNEAGRAVRRYFIEMEHRAKDPMAALEDPAVVRRLLLTYSERVLELEEDVKEMQPKVAAFDRIAVADGSMCISDTAKHLGVRPKDLFARLQAAKWIYRRAGNAHWVGYQDKIQQGLLEHKVTEVTRQDGSSRITEQCRITPKGLTKLAEMEGLVLAAA